MKTNEQKTQVWARNITGFMDLRTVYSNPQFQVEILGVNCGLHGRSTSAVEIKRQKTCRRYAGRLALLPKSYRFVSTFCSVLITPTMTWGVFVGGHFSH